MSQNTRNISEIPLKMHTNIKWSQTKPDNETTEKSVVEAVRD